MALDFLAAEMHKLALEWEGEFHLRATSGDDNVPLTMSNLCESLDSFKLSEVTGSPGVSSAYQRRQLTLEKNFLVPGSVFAPMQSSLGPCYHRSITEIIVACSKVDGAIASWKLHGTDHPLKPYWMNLAPELISDPCSSPRANWLRSKCPDELTILLELYADDVNYTNNGCRSSNDLTLSHFFIGIRNTRQDLSRSTNYWHLVFLCFPKRARYENESMLYARIYDELDYLIHNGLTLSNGEHASVRIFTATMDKKELFIRFGMNDSFNATYADHHSYLTKLERQNSKSTEELLELTQNCRRTRDSYSTDLSHLREGQASRGLDRESCFNRFEDYHVCDPGAFSACFGHDGLSGAFKQDCTRIFEFWLEQKWLDLTELNGCINKFKGRLHGKERADYVSRSNITSRRDFSIPGNMRQMSTFIRLDRNFIYLTPYVCPRLTLKHFQVRNFDFLHNLGKD